jgi:hypothetical protein
MAHGRVLRDRFYDPETVRRIATDHTRAGLTPAEVAVIDFADQVARDAISIGPDDIQRLRAHGLSTRARTRGLDDPDVNRRPGVDPFDL